MQRVLGHLLRTLLLTLATASHAAPCKDNFDLAYQALTSTNHDTYRCAVQSIKHLDDGYHQLRKRYAQEKSPALKTRVAELLLEKHQQDKPYYREIWARVIVQQAINPFDTSERHNSKSLAGVQRLRDQHLWPAWKEDQCILYDVLSHSRVHPVVKQMITKDLYSELDTAELKLEAAICRVAIDIQDRNVCVDESEHLARLRFCLE